jgi:hypothetical protein
MLQSLYFHLTKAIPKLKKGIVKIFIGTETPAAFKELLIFSGP